MILDKMKLIRIGILNCNLLSLICEHDNRRLRNAIEIYIHDKHVIDMRFANA